MIETIAKAGYEVKKIKRYGVRPKFLIYEVSHAKIKVLERFKELG